MWDEDEDQREQLVEDVKRLVREGGSIEGIVVGGDVAHSGQPEQYERAKQWLMALVEMSGCKAEDVWVVPGNHDIDRAHLKTSAILQDFRRSVRSCEPHRLDGELRRRLANDPHREVLVSALRAYNEFALPWGCGVSANEFHWRDDTLRIGDRVVVLWGMNSVLVSDAQDAATDAKTDTKANLVLGTRQCRMPRVDGTITVALVHHPPAWIRDWERVQAYVNRAHLVLFGHEHTYAARQIRPGGTVHVHAGAVGPEQGREWFPTYNLLTLTVAGNQLKVRVQPRRWLSDDTTFGPAEDQEQVFDVALASSSVGESTLDRSDREDEEGPASATPLNEPPGAGSLDESDTGPDRRRELVYRYLSAPVTRRQEIARSLGVLEQDDDGMAEGELYASILRRIRDQGLIDDLAKELSS